MDLTETLLTWYLSHQRQLPWRENQDAYKIWVSEVMLQQTRVEAVKEHYHRWLKRFPTLEELARAKEEEVMVHWQGLGYYSRARNLLKGVKETQERYGGRVPETRQELESLSGVGDYTAGAILSIAYNKKEAAVDGNVLRVFSRLFAVREDISLTQTKKHIRNLVEQLLPEERPGEFNQALMDLGALVCIPKVPRCGECPAADFCQARAQGLERVLPIKRKKAPPRPVEVVSGIIAEEGRFLLRQRPNKGLLAGMWEFPAWEGLESETDQQRLLRGFREEMGLLVEIGQLQLEFEHVFSHRHWKLRFYRCTLKEAGAPKQGQWLDKEAGRRLAFAGPHYKVAKELGF